LVRTGIHGISALLEQKTETRPQPQRRDHWRGCTMRDYIVHYDKVLDGRVKLKPARSFGSNRRNPQRGSCRSARRMG
jgi:hypothetical protein